MSTRGAPHYLPEPEPVRREALEIKLEHRERAPTVQEEVRREALEVKLAKRERGPQKKQEVRREALEVKLKARDHGEKEQEEEAKEGLEQLNKLHKVSSHERGKSFVGVLPSVADLRRKASSLVAMGGVKPSMVKQLGNQEGGAGEDAQFVGFISDAHDQMKQALAEQEAQLRRIEAAMEEERQAQAKLKERREKARMLEQHLLARQQAHAEELGAAEEAERQRIEAEEALDRARQKEADRLQVKSPARPRLPWPSPNPSMTFAPPPFCTISPHLPRRACPSPPSPTFADLRCSPCFARPL